MTTDFMRENAFSVKAAMQDPEFNNRPTVQGFVMPVADAGLDPTTRPTFSRERKIVQIVFTEDNTNVITFYNPDGSVYLNPETAADIPLDNEVHDAMNLAWTGDSGSELMDVVRAGMLKTCHTMVVAHGMADAMGMPAQRVLDALIADGMVSLPGTKAAAYRMNKAGEVVGDPLLHEGKPEEVSNED